VSERTFRAVIASVLVGALVLAFIVVAASLDLGRPEPLRGPSVVPSEEPTSEAVETAMLAAGPVFVDPGVVSVGLVSRGSDSAETLRLQFVELAVDAIPGAPGAFRVTLADHNGDETTVAFIGSPSVFAPGSLGASVTLPAPNVLLIAIEASDPFNIESITISGVGIGANPSAAIGPVIAEIGDFRGSLSGGSVGDRLPSPGTVTAQP